MKFYIHYDEFSQTSNCAFSMVFVTKDPIPVKIIMQIFQEEFRKRFPAHESEGFEFVLMRRKKIMTSNININEAVSIGDDLYVSMQRKHIGCQSNSELVSEKQRAPGCEPLGRDLTKAVLLAKCETFEKSKLYHRVVTLCESWLSANTRGDVCVYDKLIQIFLGAGRPQVALQHVNTARQLGHKNSHSIFLSHMKCLLTLNEAEEALKLLLKYAKDLRATESATKQQKHGIQMLMCRAYQKLNQRDMAIVMVQGLLREDPDHEEGLLELARLTFDLGEEQALQAATILLSALAKDRENKTVQQYLTEIAAKKGGLACIQQAAGDAWHSIPALILLANVLRDHGALDESLVILERAVSLDPCSPSPLLNYIHLLEVLGRPDEAIARVVAFCRSGCSSPVFADTASRVQHILQTKDDHTIEEFDALDVTLPSYTEEDLFVLAVWYTVVKILYTQGVLWTVQFLCASLDGFYGKGEQHLTCIRNEAAYYGCIAKIASGWIKTPGLPTALKSQPLYIVGDSHCLTPAWQTIQYKNEAHLLQPVLSTGTKIWHLCHESQFYTKSNVFRGMSMIPDGATVIMMLGEIDCRESLHVCVEKCRYESLEDAVTKLVDIYVHVLLELRSQHGWTLYVHPVPPVLDVTRPTVMLFNKHMRNRLNSDPACAALCWLNIENELLTADCSQLNRDYEFDGTHLHPRYTELLEAGLL